MHARGREKYTSVQIQLQRSVVLTTGGITDSACLGLRIDAATSQYRMGSRREREKRRRGRENQPCFQLLLSPIPQ